MTTVLEDAKAEITAAEAALASDQTATAAAQKALAGAKQLLADVEATPAPPPPTPTPSGSGAWGGYSAANPMPAGKTPGATTSAFNAPASSTVLNNSATLVGTLLASINGPSNIGIAGDWAKPTYYAQNTDPQVTLKWKTPPWSGASPGVLDGKVIRVPKGAQPAPPAIATNANSDSHMQIVLCEADCKALGLPFGYTVDMWRAQWEGASILRYQNGSFGNIAGPLNIGQATAANFDLCAGLIRGPELPGRILHELFAVTKKSNISTSFVAPATHSDGSGGPIPMGQLFKLAYTESEINALAIPTYRKTIAICAAEYGLRIGDSSSNPFGLQVECGTMYTSLGAPDLVAGYAKQVGVVAFDPTSGVDWKGRLRAVA